MVDEVIDRFPKECVYMRWFYGDATLLGNQLVLDWYAKSGLKVMAATAASEGTCVLIQTPDGRLPYIKGFSEITAERKTFEGIFATAWDDTSAHLKTVERSYIAQGEFGWNPTGRTVEEFKTAHARREFGLTRPDMEFITDMEAMRPFYDAALVTAGHRNPGFAVAEFTLVDLPDPARPGAWSETFAGRLDSAKVCTPLYERACETLGRAENAPFATAIRSKSTTAPTICSISPRGCSLRSKSTTKPPVRRVNRPLRSFPTCAAISTTCAATCSIPTRRPVL